MTFDRLGGIKPPRACFGNMHGMPTSPPRFVSTALTVPPNFAGQRLDQTLAQLLPDYSRTRIKEWIEAGQVQVDGRTLKPREKLSGGERIEVQASIEPEVPMAPEGIALDLVHRDKHVFVINKPAGLVVH